MPAADILLLYPLFDKVFFTEPVGICLLASYLGQQGFTAVVYDGFLRGESLDRTVEQVLALSPRAAGVSMNAEREVYEGERLARALLGRGYGGAIIAGGSFAGMHAEALLAGGAIDYVVVGDGEATLGALLRCLLDGQPPGRLPGLLSRHKHELLPAIAIDDLDALPLMDRGIFESMIAANGGSVAGIQATITSGRGCYAHCAFCSIHAAAQSMRGARYRERAIAPVVAEMRQLYERYGIQDFYFCSAQFLSASRRSALLRSQQLRAEVEKLPFEPSIFLYLRCDNVDREIVTNLREAGATTLFIGVESFDDATLGQLQKGLSSAQVIQALEELEALGYSADYRSKHRLKLGFMMFTPWTDLAGLRRNLTYCRRFRLPPKKMLYTLQLHEENDLALTAAEIAERENTRFAGHTGREAAVSEGYRTFFAAIFGPLERLRAIQKAQLGLPAAIEAASWAVVDAINDLAYTVFGELIDAAEVGSVEEAAEQGRVRAAELLQQMGFGPLLVAISEAMDDSRRNCPESHLNRGLDNPQVLDPQAVPLGMHYP